MPRAREREELSPAPQPPAKISGISALPKRKPPRLERSELHPSLTLAISFVSLKYHILSLTNGWDKISREKERKGKSLTPDKTTLKTYIFSSGKDVLFGRFGCFYIMLCESQGMYERHLLKVTCIYYHCLSYLYYYSRLLL